ncbi:hypothetical protein [Mycobacterium kyorinense]|nr:hypothetical protein [Mycobacterium kyorinense]
MTQDVDPRVIKQAGDAWREVHEEAAAAVNQLASVLNASAGMAGSDNGAHAWASKYDPLCGGHNGAGGVMEAASAAVMAAGQVSELLHATAVNHANGDQQSAINNPHAPAVPPAGVPAFRPPAPPSAEGGHGDVPGWWHTIQAYVQGELWPNGHQDQLHSAAQAWRKAAAGLRAAAFRANSAAPYLANQKSPEIPAAIANCNKVRDAITSAAEGCDVAAKACDDYASAIDQAHHKIIHEMEVLGATVAVTEIVAAVLIPFTAGASEAVSKVVDVSRLTAVGARIANIIREFRAAAELSSLPTVSAAGAAARSIGELAPILSARATLFTAEGAGQSAVVEGAAKGIDEDLMAVLKTDKDTAFFWSGRTSAGQGVGPNQSGLGIAADIAGQHGGVTLESLLARAGVKAPEWDANNPTSVSWWKKASEIYASGVSGEVRAVIGSDLRPGNIWQNIELKALMGNPAVTRIVEINPETGAETVVFSR